MVTGYLCVSVQPPMRLTARASLSFRLGEVTLRDFKAAVDRHGSYRYHFKALDPEFGTVKEEVGGGET